GGLQARTLGRLFRRLRREARAVFTRRDPVPLLDATALDDPLVRGLHDLREVMIRDDTFGHGHTDAEDAAAMSHARSITTIQCAHEHPSGPTWRNRLEPRRSLPRPNRYSAVRCRADAGPRPRRTAASGSDQDRVCIAAVARQD